VATIVTTAVRDVTRVVGGLATEVFEIRDSVRRARDDQEPAADPGAPEVPADLGDSGEPPPPTPPAG
jgi:hypothetical protein